MTKDSFNAFLVKNASFTPVEEYPVIRNEMVPTSYPKEIMPFDKAICFRGDLSDVFVCTYCPDETFERVRRNPRKYLSFFKRTAGIIGFDFSIHSDMNLVKQKSQMNDNRSLTYFYGNNGIPVIPNIRCGEDSTFDDFSKAIPQNSIVSIGTHGFIKTRQERNEWYCFIEDILNTIHPSAVIVYGPINGELFDDFKSVVPFVQYDPWITKRRRGG